MTNFYDSICFKLMFIEVALLVNIVYTCSLSAPLSVVPACQSINHDPSAMWANRFIYRTGFVCLVIVLLFMPHKKWPPAGLCLGAVGVTKVKCTG